MAQDREQTILDLIGWVRTLDGGYLHPAIIQKSHDLEGSPPDFTFIIDPHATRDTVKPGETLITVPLSATMSCLTFKDRRWNPNDPFSGAFPKDLDPTTGTALFLMMEYDNPRSKWRAYIRSLPQPFEEGSFGSAAWYEGEDLEWLEGTSVYAAREKQIGEWREQWRDMCDGIGKVEWVGDERMWELFKWAVSILSSRSFTSAILPKLKVEGGNAPDVFPVLIPLIDMLNHQPLNKVEWRPGGDGIGFAVFKALQPGDEIFNNYGPKSNDQLLMGYGFVIPDNPTDYYTVQIGVPPDSPLAWAKQQQAQLKEHEAPSDDPKTTFKASSASYVLNFNHPLRRDDGLEYSVFSQELLDSLSILCANDRELENLTISADRYWIDQECAHYRNLLNTLSQLLAELRARLRVLARSAKEEQPANSKQRSAQIYRDALIGIIKTALAIIEYCLGRALVEIERPTKWKEDDLFPEDFASMEPVLGNEASEGSPAVEIWKLDTFLLPNLPDSVRSRVYKALQYERNVTNEGELFTPFSASSLLPPPFATSLQRLWRFEQIPSEYAAKAGAWSDSQRMLARHVMFICCVCTLFKSGLSDDEEAMTSFPGSRANPPRAKQWMEFLLNAYPLDESSSSQKHTSDASAASNLDHSSPDHQGQATPSEEDDDDDEEINAQLPHFLDIFNMLRQRENALEKWERDLKIDLWSRERLKWAWRVATEEGVNVPRLGGFDDTEGGSGGGRGADYYLYIPQLEGGKV